MAIRTTTTIIITDTITTITTTTVMATITTAMTTTADLLRLQTWLSPAFPIGAFSYSHGIEYAVEAGLVTDRPTALDWIATLLRDGTGRIDALLLAAAWRAEDGADAIEVARLGAAMRGTAELARESVMQGAAFLTAVRAVWPDPRLELWCRRLENDATEPALPIAVGCACALAGIPLPTVLPLFLQSFAANLISAAVRLVPLGQTDGLRIQAALEPTVRAAAEAAMTAELDDIGAATPMLDWCSMRHETQYTRLFRS